MSIKVTPNDWAIELAPVTIHKEPQNSRFDRDLIIRLLNKEGKERQIRISTNSRTPIFESWNAFTFLEMLNAEMCEAIRKHDRKSEILGVQSTYNSGNTKNIIFSAKRF